MHFENSLEFAQIADKNDKLQSYRNKFFIPAQNGKDVIYFCGNSLGLQPKSTASYIAQELEDWKNLGVEGHFHAKNPWYYYHHFVEKQLSEIVGAEINEVVAMNSLSVNLNLLMVSFYRPTSTRYKIMVEADAFPSDHYAVQQQAKFHGFSPEDAIIQLYPREGEHTLRNEDILKAIEDNKDSLSLIILGGVNYYTGQVFNMKAITEAGHRVGAMVGFDLAHAVGNVLLNLHDWNVDFATWCTYKYLNSSPGGVSGIFVHARHGNNAKLPRFAGWWGNDEKTRFKMQKTFYPQEGAAGWQMSNAPVLSLAAHRASLDIFQEAGIKNLRKKSLELTGYLEFLLNELNSYKFSIITPSNPEERGCQLSLLTHADGKKLFEKIQQNGVIADWREPNLQKDNKGVIRVAPTPLYNTFEDVWRFVQIIKEA
jgi:kynureninase